MDQDHFWLDIFLGTISIRHEDMSDIKKENWHMRPLAKLTYDIDQSDSE